MKDLVITCNNSIEKTAIAALCAMCGYKLPTVNDVSKLIINGDKFLKDSVYPSVVCYHKTKEFDFTCKRKSTFPEYEFLNWSDDLEAIVNILRGGDNKVKISKDYDAIVTKSGIKVGCQDISFEDFDKLTDLVKKFR